MDQAVLEKLLTRSWRHSHEEDSGDGVTFRPEGFAFPRSRGRKGMRLDRGGGMLEISPGPGDRTQQAPGRWTIAAGPEPLLHLQPASGPAQSFRIRSLDADRLVLSPA